MSLFAQFHTDFTSGTPMETLYEIEQSSCKDTMMWAGIRTNVNGNPNLDQIMYGTMQFDGTINTPVKAFPPSNWNIFKAHPNIELLQIVTGSGNCTGYMMAFSHTFDGINYTLHIMRISESGNIICEVDPLPDLMKSDFINEMILDEDGTIVLIGTSRTSTSSELLLMRIDSSCTVLNKKRYTLAVDQDNYITKGLSITPYNIQQGPNRYAITGSIGLYSMVSLVDYALNLNGTAAIDIDNDKMHRETGIDIYNQGGVFITGRGTDTANEPYTYFTEIDYTTGPNPVLVNLKKYSLEGSGNFPKDMIVRASQNGFVIGGGQRDTTLGPQHVEPYLIKIDLGGNIVDATLQNGHFVHGRTLDVERVPNNGYMIAGDIWDAPSPSSFYIANTNSDLSTTVGCFTEINHMSLQPQFALYPVIEDETGATEESEHPSFPVVLEQIVQDFCDGPVVYDCDSITMNPSISYSNAGLNYDFISSSITSSGIISATEWEIFDPSGSSIYTSSANPVSYIFPSIDDYLIQLAIEVTLADGTMCHDTTHIILCTEEVSQRTFDITHNIKPDTASFSLGDWAMTGLKNTDEDYAIMGHFMTADSEFPNIYFARFDKDGSIINSPVKENIVAGLESEYSVVKMRERLNDENELEGYLALTNRSEISGSHMKRFQLSWLTKNGTIIDAEDFLNISNTHYQATDMVVHGDTVAITGRVTSVGSATSEIFVLLYNHQTKSLICFQRIYISNGMNDPTVIEYLGGSLYAIAGTKGKEAFYLEIDDHCISNLNALTKDVDNIPASLDIPAKIIKTPTSVVVAGTTCDSTSHNVFLWDPTTRRSTVYKLNDKGSKLRDARLLPSGNILFAGATNFKIDGTWDSANPPKAFLMEANKLTMQWTKTYASEKFEISHIAEVEVEEDGGLFATGWSMPLGPNTSVQSTFYESNTLMLKTDPIGRLFECECYQPIDVQLEQIEPFGSLYTTDPASLSYDPSILQFYSELIEEEEYVCDRYCPEDCCFDFCQDTITLAVPTILPGYFHAKKLLEVTGSSSLSGDSLDIRSEGELELLNGFEINVGDLLIAQIEECEDCCNMTDPVNDLAWLSSFPFIEDYTIERITLETECIYNLIPCGSTINHYFDCNGNYLCESGTGSVNDCPTWAIISTEIIQSCP